MAGPWKFPRVAVPRSMLTAQPPSVMEQLRARLACRHTDTVPVEAFTPHLPEVAPVIEVTGHRCLTCDATLPPSWSPSPQEHTL